MEYLARLPLFPEDDGNENRSCQESGSSSQAFSMVTDFLEEFRTDIEEIKVKVNATSCSCRQLERNSEALAEIQEQQEKQEEELTQLKEIIIKQGQLIKEIHSGEYFPRDCGDVGLMGKNVSGVYRVVPAGLRCRQEVLVYCDFVTPGGGWLVFQRRKDGSVDFYLTWNEYANGFGNPVGEFWLGNDILHQLTSSRNYKLRIDLEDFNGVKKYAEYSTFYIGSGADRYRLTVSGYSGNAGDSLDYHNGMRFSTRDSDNDIYPAENCAQTNRGAWWHRACHYSSLNGLYVLGQQKWPNSGVHWLLFHSEYNSLKTTEMKIAAVK